MQKGKPFIIVKDIKLSNKYYRITGLECNKHKYYIYHQDKQDFLRSLNKLKRGSGESGFNFANYPVKVLGTKTHRYVSTTFVDTGFKP